MVDIPDPGRPTTPSFKTSHLLDCPTWHSPVSWGNPLKVSFENLIWYRTAHAFWQEVEVLFLFLGQRSETFSGEVYPCSFGSFAFNILDARGGSVGTGVPQIQGASE